MANRAGTQASTTHCSLQYPCLRADTRCSRKKPCRGKVNYPGSKYATTNKPTSAVTQDWGTNDVHAPLPRAPSPDAEERYIWGASPGLSVPARADPHPRSVRAIAIDLVQVREAVAALTARLDALEGEMQRMNQA